MKKTIALILLLLQFSVVVFAKGNSRVDLDLSKMGSNMAYSIIFEIFIYPEKYEGKTIRVKGFFFRDYSDYIKRSFNYVMVGDQANCCHTGIEFIVNNLENIDKNFPAKDTPVMVEGVLKSYEFDGNKMYYLAVDEIQKL